MSPSTTQSKPATDDHPMTMKDGLSYRQSMANIRIAIYASGKESQR